MNNLLVDKNIAIVGGGPGGLTLARLLQMNGADVKVYERDANKNARMQGATLDLHEGSGLKALQEAGLMDAFKANYRPGADKIRVTDKYATIMLDDHASENSDRSRPEIDREQLQHILLHSLQPDTVVWDSQFISLKQRNGSFKLEFKNGTVAYADIVIAADGANSKLRSYITPIRPIYSGYTAVEGVVHHSETSSPHMHQLLKGGKIFAFGHSKSLIVSSKGDGSLVFYPCFKTGENWTSESRIDFTDKAQVMAWFKQEFSGWGSQWLELFENATGPLVPRPLYGMPLDQTWEASFNITMLGDAAHLMPPYAGEGVNMAMLDALELSNCLSSNDFPDMLTAITTFERQMRLRASEAAAASMEALSALHSPNAIENLIEIIS